MTLNFFGDVDRDIKGSIVSEYPAWMKAKGIEEMQEGIESKQRAIDAGRIAPESIPQVEMELNAAEKRLQEIVKSKPVVSGAQKDKVAQCYRAMASALGDSLFTLSDMQRGLASPHEEANRMITPHIKADKEFDYIFAACNVTPKNGKLTRNQASKILKICGAILEAPTNAEHYRRDRVTESVRVE